ncbi:response regulator transcription factor [Paraburkholderia sp. JHI869]|uniref:response regulator transcription factor n=1 Tax=Paraburkholderia sp. JHI869 TaxID=3112959 RepID=UPI00317F56BB
MLRVALVEDHERLGEMIRHALSLSGIETDVFSRISEASYGLARAEYAVLVIDRGLPDGDGLSLLRTLRAKGHTTPCLMLTARDAVHDRVDGLESGADDYVTKPFAMSELVARVRSLMRRPTSISDLQMSFADITVDPAQQTLACGPNSVQLPPAELQIALCLFKARGSTVRHATLEHAAWGISDAVTPNALAVALHRLRRRLAVVGSQVQITNIRGAGFALQSSVGAEGPASTNPSIR